MKFNFVFQESNPFTQSFVRALNIQHAISNDFCGLAEILKSQGKKDTREKLVILPRLFNMQFKMK